MLIDSLLYYFKASVCLFLESMYLTNEGTWRSSKLGRYLAIALEWWSIP